LPILRIFIPNVEEEKSIYLNCFGFSFWAASFAISVILFCLVSGRLARTSHCRIIFLTDLLKLLKYSAEPGNDWSASPRSFGMINSSTSSRMNHEPFFFIYALSERVFAYYIRLRDKYGPSVVSLAVFTGKKSQLRPNVYQSSVLGTELNFKFRTYQIFDHTEDELLAMDNPFALAVIVAQQEALYMKLNDADRQTTRMKIIKALKANSNLSQVQIKEFVLFLNRIIIVKDSKYNIIFDKQVQAITGGAITMGITETLKMLDREEGIEIGIERGIEQGMERGRHQEALEIALELKKEGLTIEFIAKTTKLSVEEIEALV
jgi:hypothetical protein